MKRILLLVALLAAACAFAYVVISSSMSGEHGGHVMPNGETMEGDMLP